MGARPNDVTLAEKLCLVLLGSPMTLTPLEPLSITTLSATDGKTSLGLGQFGIAADFNTISKILKDKGDLDGALKAAEQALDINTKIFGLERPTTATDLNIIGEILNSKGDLNGALKFTEQSLKINEALFGVGQLNKREGSNTSPILRGKVNPSGTITVP
jgi:tetratricopeptide (TPR) repeat protein